MACNTELNGIADDCKNVYGGVVEIKAIAKEHLDTVAITGGEVTALTFSTGTDLADYYFKEGDATANTESEINFDESTTVFNNHINLILKGQNLAKRNELMLLAKAQQELIVLYKLDTGVIFALGLTDGEDGKKIGARVMEITGELGARRADANKYDLQIGVEQDKELPLVVDSTVYDGLVA